MTRTRDPIITKAAEAFRKTVARQPISTEKIATDTHSPKTAQSAGKLGFERFLCKAFWQGSGWKIDLRSAHTNGSNSRLIPDAQDSTIDPSFGDGGERSMRAVAYYRVSTAEQGRSGLGLDAQRTAVEDYLRRVGAILVAEFTEVESGARNNRPQLKAALNRATLSNATLVIAKLDRLGS